MVRGSELRVHITFGLDWVLFMDNPEVHPTAHP